MSCTQSPGTHQSDKQSFLSIQNSTVGEICLWMSRFHWPSHTFGPYRVPSLAITHIWAIPSPFSAVHTITVNLPQIHFNITIFSYYFHNVEC